MRHLITDYEYTPGSRTITLIKIPDLKIEHIRLIVNETQKFVICSSMQKDLIADIINDGNNSIITYSSELPELKENDKITVEIDRGGDIVYLDNRDWVIQAKLGVVTGSGEEFEIDNAKGSSLSPIASFNGPSQISNYAMSCLFKSSYVKYADLSSWNAIKGERTCFQMFQNCQRLENIDLSGVEEISGSYTAYKMFESTAIKNFNLDNLRIINGDETCSYFAQKCLALEYVNLPKLEYIYGTNPLGYAYYGCTNLKDIDLSKLKEIYVTRAGLSYVFAGCAALKSLQLPELTIINSNTGNAGNCFANAFDGCSSLEEISVPKLTTIYGYYCFQNAFSGCNNLKRIFLPKLSIVSGTQMNYGLTIQSLEELHIGVQSLRYNDNNALFKGCANIIDLYIYGSPLFNVYLIWQNKLSFVSVLRVLEYIGDPENQAETDKLISFNDNLHYTVSQEQKTRFDAAYDRIANTVADGGLHWTISGIDKNSVVVE